MVAGQESGNNDEPTTSSVVITQGIDAAKDGIEYWSAEKIRVQEYCTPGSRQDECLNMEVRSEQQVIAWTNELAYQVDLGSKYVVHTKSYWIAKKYLSWAYKTRDAVQALFEATGRKELRIIVVGIERAIEAAEKILKLLE